MAEKNFEKFEETLRTCFRDLRIQSGKTQAQLANSSQSITQSTIAKFENGYSANVTLKTIFEISQLTSLPLSEIIFRAEGGKKNLPQEDAWSTLNREVEALSSSKRIWLAKIVREMIRSGK